MPVNFSRLMAYPALVVLISAGVALADDVKPGAPEPAVRQGKAVAEKTLCVPLYMIRQTRVLDDSTILFEMNNGITYRNELPYPCHGLKSENRFGYKTSMSQLCNTDIITVLSTVGINGPSCGLGEFVRYTPEAKKEGMHTKDGAKQDRKPGMK